MKRIFFGRQDLKYVEIHQQEAQATAQLMQELAVIFKEYDLPEAPINSFNRDLASYRQLFAGVVKLQQEIGLDPRVASTVSYALRCTMSKAWWQNITCLSLWC